MENCHTEDTGAEWCSAPIVTQMLCIYGLFNSVHVSGCLGLWEGLLGGYRLALTGSIRPSKLALLPPQCYEQTPQIYAQR